MNKTDLIKKVSQETGKTIQETTVVIDSFFREISESLRTEDVVIKDFGTFKKVLKPARVARNPITQEPINVPEKEMIKFKPSKNVLNMKWL